MLLGAEFLAMILVVVYVGAVAVLFLFVVMMLDINFVEDAPGLSCSYLPVGALIGVILLIETGHGGRSPWSSMPVTEAGLRRLPIPPDRPASTNTKAHR